MIPEPCMLSKRAFPPQIASVPGLLWIPCVAETKPGRGVRLGHSPSCRPTRYGEATQDLAGGQGWRGSILSARGRRSIAPGTAGGREKYDGPFPFSFSGDGHALGLQTLKLGDRGYQ